MRNRPVVFTCALLGMAPGLVFPSLLAGQYQSRLLSNLAATHPPAPFVTRTGSGAFTEARPATPASPMVVRWYHGLLFMGAVAALSPLDEPVRDGWQDVRSTTSNDVAKVVRHVGQPEVY